MTSTASSAVQPPGVRADAERAPSRKGSALTPQQSRILAMLREASPDPLRAAAIAEALGSTTDVVHVQVCLIRRRDPLAGLMLLSGRGGYRWRA